MTNILDAICNIVDQGIFDLMKYKAKSSIRINTVGDLLENYIKDAICDTFFLDGQKKLKIQQDILSYGGNQNNPPDLIIRDGDAFEVKKIQSFKSSIALNSSYPKNKLYDTDSRISNECRDVL
ncbi:MAG: NgoPII family restriction endonuclease [Candidatus Delongbacteria bacterium]|nr:NgoPII family restriction endonuclease [Candidatus Delongbacteria bacterium]